MTEERATAIIDSLFESYYPALVLYAKRYAQTLEQAEDIVQDALLQLYVELRNGKRINKPIGWAVVVVRRQAQKAGGQMSRFVAFDETEHPVRTPPGPLEVDSAELAAFFPVLTEREHEVMFLRLGGLKYREIAKELQITISSVNTILARALRKLQAAMQAGNRPKAPLQGIGDGPSKILQ